MPRRRWDRIIRPIDCLTVGEVARLANCTTANVALARDSGKLAAFVVEGRYWHRDDDVAVWLASRKTNSTAAEARRRTRGNCGKKRTA